jgi:hypothetical protein
MAEADGIDQVFTQDQPRAPGKPGETGDLA